MFADLNCVKIKTERFKTYGNVGGSKPLEFYKLISDR